MKLNKTQPVTALHRADDLLGAVEAISGELELQPLLALIAQVACRLTEAEQGLLGLIDPERRVLRLEATYHLPNQALGVELAPDVGLVGRLFQSQQPLRLDRYGDLAWPLHPQLADHAVLGLPILKRETMIGFLGVIAKPSRRFRQHDLETLTHFVRYAAIAIDNARRFTAEKHRAARLATINHVGQLIASSLNLDQLLQTTVEAIAEHLHYPNVALLLVDPGEPDSVVLRASSGAYASPEIVGYRQHIDQGIIGAAARDRQYVLIHDVQNDPRYISIPNYEVIRDELAVPIIIADQLLGVLNIESENALSEEDAADFVVIADQLGVAIDKGYRLAEAKSALNEAQLLYQTSQRIGMALDVDGVIQAYLEQVATRGRYACNIVLYEFDEAGQKVAVVVRGRWTPQEGLVQGNERYPHSRDALDPLLDAGETISIADVHNDPRVPPGLRQIQLESGRPALAFIPLMARERRIGLVVLSYTHVHEWDETDLQPYQATAAQLATAIDSRRQRQLLYKRGQQIAILQERQRLARDLHDSVTQLIFSITLIAQSISPAWRRNPDEGEHRVKRLLELSQLALAEMRALLAELRPTEPIPAPTKATGQQTLTPPISPAVPGIMQIERNGLVVALRKYIADINRDGLQVDFDTNDYRRQPLEQEKVLYRITQEAFNNIVKHAQARQITLRLSSDTEAIYLIVTDDGIGFARDNLSLNHQPSDQQQTSNNQAGGGLGLSTMRERAEALGGTVQLTTRPGQGTTVAVILPSTHSKSEKG